MMRAIGRKKEPHELGTVLGRGTAAPLNDSKAEEHFMKAIVCTRYGPPELLQLKEIATPTPADNEVLIKICAASVNPLDSFSMRGPLFFLPMIGARLKPKHQIIGADLAGRVEAVGKDV